MRNPGLLLAAAAILAIGHPTAEAKEVPATYVQDVKLAKELGAALYEAEKAHALVDEAQVAAARKLLPEVCSFSYEPLVIAHDGKTYVYFIAHGTPDTDIMVGRHFRVDGNEVVVSSKTCLDLGTLPINTKIAVVVHLTSAAPTEFHVLQSLRQPIPLIVAASSGNWLLYEGKIFYEGPRGP